MGINIKGVETLHKLGLTPLQAKIYLISLDIGREKIKNIASVAKIDRSNAHCLVRQLQDMGLITKILGNPNVYEAIPLKEAVETLLKLKEKEFNEIKEEAREVSNKIFSKDGLTRLEPQLEVFKRSKESIELIIMRSCKTAEQNSDMILNTKNLVAGMINLSKYHFDCIKKGVKYRIVAQEIALNTIGKRICKFNKYPNFQIRFISDTGPEIGIMDGKLATLLLNSNVAMGESYILHTNNADMIEIFQSHFEKIWNEAKEYKFEQAATVGC